MPATFYLRDIGNEFLFTGRRLDPEKGLQINRRRYYHPQLGRWLTRDPIGYRGETTQLDDLFVSTNLRVEKPYGFAGDYNLYQYVKSRPTNAVDPSGLYEVIRIGMGHDGECERYLGGLPKPKTGKGKLGAVCCNHDEVMEGLPHKNPVPGWPSQDDIPDTDGDGRLDCEDVDGFIKIAWRSAYKYLKGMCDKGVSKPSAEIEWSQDLVDCVEHLLAEGDLTRNPCNIEIEYDCKTKKIKIYE